MLKQRQCERQYERRYVISKSPSSIRRSFFIFFKTSASTSLPNTIAMMIRAATAAAAAAGGRTGMFALVPKAANSVLSTNSCNVVSQMRSFSDGGGSITYSGGQATQGQGGFYGSGGSRAGGKFFCSSSIRALAPQTLDQVAFTRSSTQSN
jgi:hypothetical protein